MNLELHLEEKDNELSASKDELLIAIAKSKVVKEGSLNNWKKMLSEMSGALPSASESYG